MAASANIPRLSFGAGNTLDLSLNLPAMFMPSSSSQAQPKSDWESDDDFDRRSSIETAKTVETSPEKEAPQPAYRTQKAMTVTRPYKDGHNDDEGEDDLKTPTRPTLSNATPVIPERNMRRTNNNHAAAPATTTSQTTPPPESTVPLHPIPAMQPAFAESLLEVTDGKPVDKPKLRFADARARREELISQERDDPVYNNRWRYRPGQKEHELSKLMSQISFGVHLLLNGMANSATQVVTILQGHIDEVDEFLEVTMEDYHQASVDLKERVDYLRLPMENMDTFEKLLEDRNFRLQIVEGNEKIEHIIVRTNAQLRQCERDIRCGIAAAREFAIYLNKQKDGPWRRERPDVVDIFEAMKGNTEGWSNAFADLQSQGKELNVLVAKLGQIVTEMGNKAGEVSRKTWADIPPFSIPLPETPVDGPVKSSPISAPSTRSVSRSTPRNDSIGGSAPTSSHSNVQTAYFELPIKKADSIIVQPPKQPPTKTPVNHAPKPSLATSQSQFSDTRSMSGSTTSQDAEASAAPFNDEPVFLLQPRTYTPQPPEPLPSPVLKQEKKDTPTRLRGSASAQQLTKKTSIRERVSLKIQPPEAIQIPPPTRPSDFPRPPRGSPSARTPDSAYHSDDQRPRFGSMSTVDMSPPTRPSVMASSPLSDHQFYRPVQASPHSPLQQRPQTAGASPYHPSFAPPQSFQPGHQRNAPSRMGGASMLSNVTTMTYDSQSTATDKKLKKKRSAFGWLKKAFSLDEEERLQYEARKNQQAQNLYYDQRSPKYLDGRRVNG